MKCILFIAVLAFSIVNLKGQCPDVDFLQVLPSSDSIQCVERGDSFTSMLSIGLFESVTIPEYATIFIFDSIVGLPSGIYYEFDRQDKTYSSSQPCITFSGITNDTVRRYPLYFYVTVISIDISAPPADTAHGELIIPFNDFLRRYSMDTIQRPFLDVIDSNSVCDHQMFSSVSILEKNSHSFVLYPNPTNEIITLSFDKDIGTFDVQLFNLFGEIVLQSNSNTGTMLDLDVSNLAKGIYLYKIGNSKEMFRAGRVVIN